DVARDQGGDQREHPDRAEEQQHEREGQAGLVDVAAEGDVLGTVAPAVERHSRDEDDRHHGRQPEAEVGALLGAQLAQLPAVDGQYASHHSVKRKKSSSSVGAWGTRAVMATPVSTSA